MRGFKVIDKKTGKEVNPKEIALSKNLADVDTTKGSVFYQVVKKIANSRKRISSTQ